jgi:hypothetical protein
VKHPLSPVPISLHQSPQKVQRINKLAPTPVTPPTTPVLESPVVETLGEYAKCAARLLRRLGWDRFIKTLQFPSYLATSLKHAQHTAANYLQRLANTGVPAPSSAPPWPASYHRKVFQQGPHLSASRFYKDFLITDIIDYVKKHFWVMLPYSAVAHYPHLKLAPCGVMPQRERRPRPIMDYMFTGVNQHSLPLASADAMQIGYTLPRILQRLAYANPSFSPPAMLKFDLSV